MTVTFITRVTKVTVTFITLLAGCAPPPERRPDPWERYAAAPVEPGNVVVRVETYDFAAEDQAAFDVAVRYRDPRVRVAVRGWGGENGMTLFAGIPDFRVVFRAESRRFRSRRSVEQMLMVADGYEARFQAVRERAVPVASVIPICLGSAVLRTLRHEVTGAGLAVRPRSREDGRIDVELTPWLAVREGAARREIRVTELTTSVTVRPGQPVVILSNGESQESFGATLFSSWSTAATRRKLMVLVVEK